MPNEFELEELEAEVSGHAQSVKEAYAEYRRYIALAESGALCVVCGWRKMAVEGELGAGQGLCESCADEALSIYMDAVRG